MKYFLFLSFVLINVFQCLAQVPDVLVEGLSFECSNCRQVSEQACEVEANGVISPIDCKLLLPKLFELELASVDGSELPTILEYAQGRGMSVGLVTTKYISDATPAAFASHVSDQEPDEDDPGHGNDQFLPDRRLPELEENFA